MIIPARYPRNLKSPTGFIQRSLISLTWWVWRFEPGGSVDDPSKLKRSPFFTHEEASILTTENVRSSAEKIGMKPCKLILWFALPLLLLPLQVEAEGTSSCASEGLAKFEKSCGQSPQM